MATKKMNRRSFLKYAGGAMGTTMALKGFPSILRGAEPDPVKIGGLYALSGPLALLGQANRMGAVSAVEEINAAGGIKALGGAKLQLLDGDVQVKPEIGIAEAERMIGQGAVCLIGAMISSVTYATTQVAEKNRVPHIAVAFADDITERGFKYTFRTEGKNDRIAHELVRNLMEMDKIYNAGIKTAVTFHENSVWGKDMVKGITKWADKLRAFKILDEIFFQTGTPNMTPEILRAKSLKPDILIPGVYAADGMLMVKTMYDQRFDVKAVVGSGSAGLTLSSVIKELGKLSEYLMNCVPWVNDKAKGFDVISQKFKARWGLPIDFYAGHLYSCVKLVADALERSRSRDPEALREALVKTNFRDHIEAQLDPVRFDASGDNINAGSPIGQNLGGEYRIVYPKEFATANPVFPVPNWSKRGL